ncbi:MAG: class I SAM-dependent methyltransferase [Flavobacteriales bacterium]|nr:class I SAM-dependent methyltransferase [Flavobacteriales bacterium]
MRNGDSEELAAQLRKPSGEMGLQVADFMNKGNELLNRNTIDKIDFGPGKRVVEVGMGNGKFVAELFERQCDIYYSGCDYSELMIAEAERINRHFIDQKKANFYQSQAANLPFDAHSIDIIFTVNTIYFWENYHAVLNEFKRVLKSCGQLVIGMRAKEQMQHYGFVKHGFQMFHPREVEQLLTTSAFKNVNSYLINEPDFITENQVFKIKSLIVSANT